MENAINANSIGVTIKATAVKEEECGNNTPSIRFARLIKNKFIQNNPKDEIADIPDQESINNLLNAKTDNGAYCAEITFGKTRLVISQSGTDTNTVLIRDLNTDEEVVFHDISFESLQKQMLQQYIHGHRLLHFTVDLSLFNLTKIELSDLDLAHTIINRQTFDALVASGLDVRGTALAAGEDTTGLNLVGVALDKPLAESLINAGADFKSVLISYLASPRGTFSHLFLAELLFQYLSSEQRENNLPIDLSAFDLRNICFDGINLSHTILSNENLKAIIAAGGNLKAAALYSVPHLTFDEHGMTKHMAMQLINAGMDRHFVLTTYFDSERAKKNTSINIDGLNLTKNDLKNLDLRNVDLNNVKPPHTKKISAKADAHHNEVQYRPTSFRDMASVKKYANLLFRFEGQLQVGGKKFLASNERGQAKVKEIPKKFGWFAKLWSNFSTTEPSRDAKHLQRILNSSRARKEEMAQMTHAALPSALRHLTRDQWNQIGNGIVQAIQSDSGPNFGQILIKNFKQDIYKQASAHVQYAYSNTKEVRDIEWDALIINARKNRHWKPNGIRHAKRVSVQTQHNPNGGTSEHILRSHYNMSHTPSISRLQFVVSSEAGPALYFDLAKLMDQYIDNECNGDPALCPVRFFKVYSEDKQVGRSDSAVFYFLCPLNDKRVQKLVTYLEHRLEERLVPMPIVGATKLGHGYVYGTTIPDNTLQKRILGHATGSNGALTRNILAAAYQQAYGDVQREGVKQEDINAKHLNQRAQYYAKEIWHELGLAHSRRRRANGSPD